MDYFNRYWYGNNNPTNLIDPDGADPWPSDSRAREISRARQNTENPNARVAATQNAVGEAFNKLGTGLIIAATTLAGGSLGLAGRGVLSGAGGSSSIVGVTDAGQQLAETGDINLTDNLSAQGRAAISGGLFMGCLLYTSPSPRDRG